MISSGSSYQKTKGSDDCVKINSNEDKQSSSLTFWNAEKILYNLQIFEKM